MAQQNLWLAPIGVVAFVSAIVSAGAEGQRAQKMSLEAHLHQVIGFDAVDCGTHTRDKPVPEAMHESLACARDTERQHRAFRIIQRGPSEDSEFAVGVLGKPDGSILWFEYDSAPCGGPACAERFETTPCLLSAIAVIHDAQGRHQFACIRFLRPQ